jgi:hypothetical protein
MSVTEEESYWAERANGVLDKVFGSCADDPKGSVHRAWGVSLLFVLFYFAISIVESEFHVAVRNYTVSGFLFS